MNYFRKTIDFLKEDSWQSWIVSLILIFIVIKWIFFPLLTIVTGSPLPLVVVESCSMYHESDFNEWWSRNAVWYESRNISKTDFESFSFKSGLNKGDNFKFLYDFGDLSSLEKYIEVLFKNKKLRENMKKNNLKKSKEFLWENITNDLEKVYKEIFKNQ